MHQLLWVVESQVTLSLLEPNVYRAVIDDVIDAIKPEFEEYGVPEDVLAELQRVSFVFFLVHSFCQFWAVTEMGG